ncbi:hypothetical protein QTP86_028397 [Hemibagrus guttatus]|nr:hypothetical protein QTP86_028397 [Hemibagrus guttatus]
MDSSNTLKANVALEEIALLKINKTVVLTYASIDRSGHAGVCPECCCALRRTERKKVKEREKAMAGETDADILLQSGSVSRNKWKHRTSASSDGLKWKCCECAGPSSERREGAFQNRRIERAAPAASQRCSCL